MSRISLIISPIIRYKRRNSKPIPTVREARTRLVTAVRPAFPPMSATHAALSSPRPARALNVVVFMHLCGIASSHATTGRKGGSKGLFFYAFSCAFMHFLAAISEVVG